MIVVIPCYSEDEVHLSLESLRRCNPPPSSVEVIVVVNFGIHESTAIKSKNIQSANQVELWAKANDSGWIKFHIIRAFNLPEKQAGVGLARKIGMDEAVRRFESVGEKEGIIVCFDADCLCTENYLLAIDNFFKNNPNAHAGLLGFEHNLELVTDEKNREAIINYELHLRYYVQALKYAHFPYAFHTIGSCITVKSSIYQKQGGMNTRKAGEDFYFLQKLFPLGHVHNVPDATVYPSSRPSHRVPFGTGRSVQEMLNDEHRGPYFTYNPESFVELKLLCETIHDLWQHGTSRFIAQQGTAMKAYLASISFTGLAEKIRRNSSSESQFVKSFFAWFNGFMVLKFIHFSRDHFYEKTEILEACSWVLNNNPGKILPKTQNKVGMLELLRKLDRLQ